MQTIDSIRVILANVSFPNWTVQAHLDGDRPYLQVACQGGRCNTTGAAMDWTGRKWFLSPHMTKSEIVGTAFKAIMTATEHEVREQFLYRGQAVFGPHFNVDLLWELARMGEFGQDAREAS